MRNFLKTPLKEGFTGTVNISGSFVNERNVCMELDLYVKIGTINELVEQFDELKESKEELWSELHYQLRDNIESPDKSLNQFGEALIKYICSAPNTDIEILTGIDEGCRINAVIDIYETKYSQITVTSSRLTGRYIFNHDYNQICDRTDFTNSDIYFTLPTKLELLNQHELHFLFEMVKTLKAEGVSSYDFGYWDKIHMLQEKHIKYSIHDEALIDAYIDKLVDYDLIEDGEGGISVIDLDLYEFYFNDIFKDKAA